MYRFREIRVVVCRAWRTSIFVLPLLMMQLHCCNTNHTSVLFVMTRVHHLKINVLFRLSLPTFDIGQYKLYNSQYVPFIRSQYRSIAALSVPYHVHVRLHLHWNSTQASTRTVISATPIDFCTQPEIAEVVSKIMLQFTQLCEWGSLWLCLWAW